jgi:alpha-tubulin suppressor-like RCC1 family protein
MGPNLLTVIILVLFVRQYACQCMNGKNCFYTFDAAYSWGANNYGANGDGVPQQQEYAVLINTTNIPGPISKISSKVDHAIIISNGKIYAWGKNEFGQIGDGSQISRYLPVLVRMEFEIIDIATGSFHSVALARNGRVYTWGNGINGNLGNRKNISLVPSPVDTSGVLRGKNITSITSGSEYTVVLSDTGQLYAWGAGNEGQLGNGYQYGRLTPVQVNMTGFQNEIVVMVSAGWSHTIALTSSGRVYTWGRGADGQLGVGCCGNVLSPIAVNLQIPIVSIGTGFYHTFAIANNGVIFAWGDNRSGQLGDGTTNIRVRPTVVYMQGIASGSTVQKITGGQLHSVAITNDGRIYAWGDNSLGQLGDGSTLSRYIPIPVFDAKTTITSMTAAQFSTFCLSKNGTAYSWGSNNAGQLGNGIIPFRVLPVTVKMPQGITVQSISCGAFHTIALLNNGQMYAWGQNTYGQLGDGSTVNRYIPVPVDINVSQVREYKFAAIAAGIEHSVALTEEGEVFTWGRGWAGQLGEGTTNDRLRPTQIVQSYGMFFGELVKSIAAGGSNTAALTDKGRVYIWGSNQYGQLCNGAQTNGLLPTQVKQLLNHYVIAISVGDSFVLALTKEGTIFSWGANNCGQLGIGTIVASAIPVMVQLPVDIKAAKIAAGGYHALMLTNTGQLYAWGYGSYGQLGIGSAATELNPVALNMTRFRYSVTGIAAGRSHSMAILQDGGIYAWGAGDVGQLGYGETSDQFLPIQVSMKQYPSAKKAIAISASNAASFALFIRCSNGFVGDYCDIPVCFGENATDTDIVCNGRGNCTAPDKCTCYPNSLYEGLNCEYPICFGSSLFKNNTTPLCSNNGKCIGPDLCECTSKLFFGKECEQSVLVWIAIALVVTIIGLVILFMPILLFLCLLSKKISKTTTSGDGNAVTTQSEFTR